MKWGCRLDRKKKFGFVVGAIFAAAGASAAEPPLVQTKKYGDWTVRCVERAEFPPCDIVQSAVQSETEEQVTQISIAYIDQAGAYGVQIKTPLGVRLDADVDVKVDNKKSLKGFKFTRCDQGGCYIERFMKAGELEPFHKGAGGELVLYTPNGGSMRVPLSFHGFRKAVSDMTKRNREWANRA